MEFSQLATGTTVNFSSIGIVNNTANYLIIGFGGSSITETENLKVENANAVVRRHDITSQEYLTNATTQLWGIRCKAAVPMLISAHVQINARGVDSSSCDSTLSYRNFVMLLEDGKHATTGGIVASNFTLYDTFVVPAFEQSGGLASSKETAFPFMRLVQCVPNRFYQIGMYLAAPRSNCVFLLTRGISIREL